MLKKSACLLHLISDKVHVPHAIAGKLHVRKINVVILTPETAGTVGV